MVYCPKCGTKNEDDAVFCKNCGASLETGKKPYEHGHDDRCEEECGGGPGHRGWTIFWGVVIVLIGLIILFEVVLKDMAKTYSWLDWVNTVQWGWIFGAVVAIFVIIIGLRIISRKH